MRFRISIAAQISCVCFISGRKIVFLGSSESFFSFTPGSSSQKMDTLRMPTISCAFVPNTPGQDFRQVWSRRELTPWSCRALRARGLKPSTMEKWLSTCVSLGCIWFSRDNLKPVGMLWHPLAHLFFSGVPGLFIPVTVLFSTILNLLFCGPPASQGHMAAPGL